MLRALVVSACIVGAIAFPAVARAADTTVDYKSSTNKLTVATGNNHENSITITEPTPGTFVFEETGTDASFNDLTIGETATECTKTDTQVTCVKSGLAGIDVDLKTGSDTLDAQDAYSPVPHPVTVDMTVTDTGDDYDDIETGSGNDTVDAGGEGDYVDGGAGDDTLNGGAGEWDDSLYGGDGNDTLNAGDGDDSTVSGDDGNDALNGGNGDDELDGGDGSDTFKAEPGADDMIGGEDTDDGDIDTVDYSARSSDVSVSLDDDPSDGGTADYSPSLDYSDNVESDVEQVLGGSGNDVLIGSFDNDRLFGNGGIDTLRGEDGDDQLDGGGGADYVDYSTAFDGVKVDLSRTTSQNTDNAGLDKLTSLENLIGSDYDDKLVGSSVANVINSGAGTDTVDTRDSSVDTVNCGADSDSLRADTSDMWSACESVDLPPVPPAPTPPSPPTPPAGDLTAPVMTLPGKVVKMTKSGTIAVTVGCPASESSCSGDIVLSTKAQVGKASFSIAGGASKKVTIKLSASAKKTVKKKKKLTVKAKITARDAAGNSVPTQTTLTIKK